MREFDLVAARRGALRRIVAVARLNMLNDYISVSFVMNGERYENEIFCFHPVFFDPVSFFLW